MYKKITDLSMCQFIADNLNYKKIPFRVFVTDFTHIEIVIENEYIPSAESICKGWVKIMSGYANDKFDLCEITESGRVYTVSKEG